MLIPRVMNGLEKSITFSLSDVMVKPATARSAFWRIDKDREVVKIVEEERERERQWWRVREKWADTGVQIERHSTLH